MARKKQTIEKENPTNPGGFVDDTHPEEIELAEADRVYWKIYWSGIARTALKRFPELQRGESAGVKEIKRKLNEIRKSGYSVKPCSSLDKEESWNYLTEIRRDIRNNAERYCPRTLAEIDKENERQRLEARL